jgi:hypothetical protein
LEQEIFTGTHSELFRPFTVGFEGLPSQLFALSRTLGDALDRIGKPGHKTKNFANLRLVQASEFVKWKLRQHFDEHLAELIQAIPCEGRSMFEDLSGAAIRKKRKYIKSRYPDLYAEALGLVEAAAHRGARK